MQESMAQEGKELAKASFGTTILLAIGKTYEGQASIYLGGFFQGGFLSLRQDTQSLKSKASILDGFQPMCITLSIWSIWQLAYQVVV